MPIIDAYPAGYTMTNDEIIREVTCLAIAQRNAAKVWLIDRWCSYNLLSYFARLTIIYIYIYILIRELGLYSSITFRQVTGAVLVVFTILHSRLWIWLHPGPSQSFIKQNVASVDPRFARFISLGLNQRMKVIFIANQETLIWSWGF